MGINTDTDTDTELTADAEDAADSDTTGMALFPMAPMLIQM